MLARLTSGCKTNNDPSCSRRKGAFSDVFSPCCVFHTSSHRSMQRSHKRCCALLSCCGEFIKRASKNCSFGNCILQSEAKHVHHPTFALDAVQYLQQKLRAPDGNRHIVFENSNSNFAAKQIEHCRL